MSRTEFSAVLEEVGKMAIREFDVPHIGSEEALLKVELAGVCGTDPKIYRGKRRTDIFPLIMGHEILGHIEEIGSAAKARYKVDKGDRVILEAVISCGSCPYCLTGNYRFCEKELGYGARVSTRVPPSLWGAYGQFMYIAPGSIVYKISEDVPAEAAVLTNAVISNGIQWVRIMGRALPGDIVLVQGMGQQGLSATIAARESGASLIIVTGLTVDGDRFGLAKEFGANLCIDVQKEDVIKRVVEATGGKMPDLVVDVTGSPEAIVNSVNLVRKQGTVVCAGVVGSNKATSLVTDKIVSNEIRFQGAFTSGHKAVSSAIALIESRKYPIEKMVTHKFALREAEQAVMAVGGEVPGTHPIKAVIVP